MHARSSFLRATLIVTKISAREAHFMHGVKNNAQTTVAHVLLDFVLGTVFAILRISWTCTSCICKESLVYDVNYYCDHAITYSRHDLPQTSTAYQ